MKGLWGFGAFSAVCVTATVLFVGYGVPYRSHHQTTITKEEVVIGRVAGWGAGMTYALDKLTGDELLRFHRYGPLIRGE